MSALTIASPRAPAAGEETAAVAVPTRAAAGAGWLGLGAVVSKTCQTAVLLIFAAVLAPEEFGLISLAAVLLNVTVVLADLGTSTALVQLRGDAERAARSALSLALVVSGSLLALAWFAAPWLASTLHVGAQGTGVFRGIVLCLPLAAAAGVSAELLRRALDFRRRVLPDIAGNVLGALVTVTALAAGSGAYALVIGQLAQAVVVLVAFWLLRPPVVPGWSRTDVRSLLSFGGSLAASSMVTLAVLNVDYVLIAHRLGAEDVGVYSMAFRLAYLPYLLIAMVIGGAAFAHLSRMRGAAFADAAHGAALLLHALVVPLYAGLLVLAPQLRLLGEAWAPAVPALRWLAGYGLLLSALELLVVTLKAVGRTSDILALTGLHFLLLLGLLLAFVDRGVTAAAVCQVAAGAVTLAAGGLIVTRRVGRIDGARLLRRLLPVIAGAGVLVATVTLLQPLLPVAPVSVAGLVIVGPACLAAYLLTVRVLDPHDHTGLARTLRPRRSEAVRSGSTPLAAGPAILPTSGPTPPPTSPATSPTTSPTATPTARRRRARRPRVAHAPRAALLLVVAGILAAGAGVLAVFAPVAALIGLAIAAVLAAAAYRLEWAALLLVVVEPFGDLLRDVHPAAVKAVGLLLFVSWMLRLLASPRPGLPRHPGLGAVGVLVLVLLGSFVAHGADLSVGLDHGVTYLAYALVVLVLVDTLRHGRRTVTVLGRQLAVGFLLSCTAAAAVGTVVFLAQGGRATGPVEDPNDLAFFLIAAMPFALVAAHRRSPMLAGAAGLSVAVLAVGTAATFSRGALLALLVMAVVAVALRAVRLSTAVVVAGVAAVVLALGWLTHSAVIDRSIAEKEHIAAANVDSRLTTWTMAADMTADSPLLGQGPGGFAAEAPHYIPAGVGAVQQSVAHNMYLDVAAELGLAGLFAFLAVVGYAVRGALRARRAAPPGTDRRVLADAVLIAFAGTLVAACFLSEQFYLPLWLLVALGIALDTGPARPESTDGRAVAGHRWIQAQPREGAR